jgi:hypothetical protein
MGIYGTSPSSTTDVTSTANIPTSQYQPLPLLLLDRSQFVGAGNYASSTVIQAQTGGGGAGGGSFGSIGGIGGGGGGHNSSGYYYGMSKAGGGGGATPNATIANFAKVTICGGGSGGGWNAAGSFAGGDGAVILVWTEGY